MDEWFLKGEPAQYTPYMERESENLEELNLSIILLWGNFNPSVFIFGTDCTIITPFYINPNCAAMQNIVGDDPVCCLLLSIQEPVDHRDLTLLIMQKQMQHNGSLY